MTTSRLDFNFTTSAPSTLSSPSITSGSFDFALRAQEINARIAGLINRISPGKSFDALVGSFATPPSMALSMRFRIIEVFPFLQLNMETNPSHLKIRLPVQFLFKQEDIPPQFRINSLDDPRLNDVQFLKSFGEWVNSIHRQLHVGEMELPEDKLREFLTLFSDRNLFEKCKDFILAHEISHGLEGNQHISVMIANQGVQIALMFALGLGIALLALSVGLIPFVSLPIIISLATSGLLMTGIPTFTIFQAAENCREIEKKCDINAANILNDAQGGIHFFQNRLSNNSLRASPPLISKFTNIDQLVQDFIHPSTATREAYLQEWQNNHNAGRTQL